MNYSNLCSLSLLLDFESLSLSLFARAERIRAAGEARGWQCGVEQLQRRRHEDDEHLEEQGEEEEMEIQEEREGGGRG